MSINDNKYLETGSNPYHLNLNTTAKDYSANDYTNPGYGLLDALTKFIVIEKPIMHDPFIIKIENNSLG